KLSDLPTHILMLLTMRLFVFKDTWEVQDIPGDFKCKALVFVSSTCFRLSPSDQLSQFGPITIRPTFSAWLTSSLNPQTPSCG
ncbi:hypothetical protein V4Y02_23590, partial [Escherichia coli]